MDNPRAVLAEEQVEHIGYMETEKNLSHVLSSVIAVLSTKFFAPAGCIVMKAAP